MTTGGADADAPAGNDSPDRAVQVRVFVVYAAVDHGHGDLGTVGPQRTHRVHIQVGQRPLGQRVVAVVVGRCTSRATGRVPDQGGSADSVGGRFEFVRSQLPTSASCAVVLIRASGAPKCYPPDVKPTRGELVAGNYRRLYEVDTGHHRMTLIYNLPSDGDAFQFQAEVDLAWRVADPMAVVRAGVRDVRALVEPKLQDIMRSQTRRFEIDESAAAEQAVSRALHAAELATEEGLAVDCTVRLSLDASAMQQRAKLRSLKYAKEAQVSKHELDRLESRHGQELHEEQIEFIVAQLGQGDIRRWALQIVQNPEDLPLALEGIRADDREAAKQKLWVIDRLVEAGLVEPHMMDDAAKVALDSIRATFADTANGKARQIPLREQIRPAESPVADGQ